MQLHDLLRYFAIVVLDGDHLNDWLTHLPSDVAPAAQTIGQFIANILF